MNALKYAFGLILVGGFALTASCGGSSDTTTGSTGGSSSSTGGSSSSTGGGLGFGNNTGSGGTFSSGGFGTSNGGSGTATTGGTGTATGGTGNLPGGGATGTAGTGGRPNPAGCPATAPAVTMAGTPGESCTPLANNRQTCNYVVGTNTETCRCRVPFNGGGQAGAGSTDGTWQCTVAPTPIACPMMPATGDACSGFGCPLPNRGGFCACVMGKLDCMTFGAAGAAG